MHLNEGPALARALEKLPRSLRQLQLTSLDGMRTSVPLGMQLQGLTQVTGLTLKSRWGCGLSPVMCAMSPGSTEAVYRAQTC